MKWGGVVQPFSMHGTRVQGKGVKLRLSLLPVRLSEVSKLVLNAFIQPPHLRVFYALVGRAVSKQSLSLMRRETVNR